MYDALSCSPPYLAFPCLNEHDSSAFSCDAHVHAVHAALEWAAGHRKGLREITVFIPLAERSKVSFNAVHAGLE